MRLIVTLHLLGRFRYKYFIVQTKNENENEILFQRVTFFSNFANRKNSQIFEEIQFPSAQFFKWLKGWGLEIKYLKTIFQGFDFFAQKFTPSTLKKCGLGESPNFFPINAVV